MLFLVGGIADMGSSWHHCMNNRFLDNVLYCTCGINQPCGCRPSQPCIELALPVILSLVPFIASPWFSLCLTTFSLSSPNVPQGWEGPSWCSGDPEQPEWPHGDPKHLPAAEEPECSWQKPVRASYSSNQWALMLTHNQWHVRHTFQCFCVILVLELDE